MKIVLSDFLSHRYESLVGYSSYVAAPTSSKSTPSDLEIRLVNATCAFSRWNNWGWAQRRARRAENAGGGVDRVRSAVLGPDFRLESDGTAESADPTRPVPTVVSMRPSITCGHRQGPGKFSYTSFCNILLCIYPCLSRSLTYGPFWIGHLCDHRQKIYITYVPLSPT